MSAGLAASTATPGKTAPDWSVTMPSIEPLCANAMDETNTKVTMNANTRADFILSTSPGREADRDRSARIAADRQTNIVHCVRARGRVVRGHRQRRAAVQRHGTREDVRRWPVERDVFREQQHVGAAV